MTYHRPAELSTIWRWQASNRGRKIFQVRPFQAFVRTVILSIPWYFGILSHSQAADDCPAEYFLSIKIERRSNCEKQHLAAVGSGIAAPSVLSTFGENPAGYIYNNRFKLALSTTKMKKGYGQPNLFSTTAAHGNGFFGGGFGIHQMTSRNVDGFNERSTLASYGLGWVQKSLGSAVGLNVHTENQGQSSTYGADIRPKVGWDIGTILNAKGNFRTGVTVFNAGGERKVYALGTAVFIGSNCTATVDGAANYRFMGKVVRPAFGCVWKRALLSTGYGYKLDKSDDAAWTPAHFNLNLAAWISEEFRIVYYFNRLEYNYLGLSLRF